MPTLAQLISDLSQATQQMKRAAEVEDWTLAAQIQKHRAALVERLLEQAEETPPSEADGEQLKAVRKLEAEIAGRAALRRRLVGEALEQLQSGTPAKRKSRMQKAYGLSERER